MNRGIRVTELFSEDTRSFYFGDSDCRCVGDGRLVLGNVETDCDGKAVLACGIGE